jgi:hypothetical protein
VLPCSPCRRSRSVRFPSCKTNPARTPAHHDPRSVVRYEGGRLPPMRPPASGREHNWTFSTVSPCQAWRVLQAPIRQGDFGPSAHALFVTMGHSRPGRGVKRDGRQASGCRSSGRGQARVPV